MTNRPKKFVGSSGSVWASNLVWLHHQYPDYFEVETSQASVYSGALRSLFASLRDIAFYFEDTTTQDDISALCTSCRNSEFRKYEVERLNWLQMKLSDLKMESDADEPENEKEMFQSAEEMRSKLHVKASELKILIQSEPSLESCLLDTKYASLCSDCHQIIKFAELKRLSFVYPYLAEYTDAGPGVGVSNVETKIRFVEMCRLQNSDRQIRIHRAPGDSAQNEAERTNACICDAIVDGGSLEWENFHPLKGLTDEQINQLSIEDLETRERQSAEKNAWHVAQELTLRMDDEPGPGGDFMIANVSERLGKCRLICFMVILPFNISNLT